MIRRSWALWLALIFMICMLLAGCGENFRPTIIPQPAPGGDPSANSQAVVLSNNPSTNVAGSADMHVNIGGDTVVNVVQVGANPQFLGKTTGRVFIIDGNGSATLYSPTLAPSQAGTATSVVTFPSNATGAVSGAGVGGGDIFITNSSSDNVSRISNNAVVQTIDLGAGARPVAAVASTLANKVYVLNNGANTVTVISALDDTIINTINVGKQPIWATISADGEQVYVVNQGDGTVSVIDTNLDQNFATIPVGTSPNFAFFDPKLLRVYVTNTGSSTLSIIKGDGVNLQATPPVIPTKLKDVTLSAPAVSVVALSDGTRAYAALGGCPAGTNHTNLMPTTNPPSPGNIVSCTGNRVSVVDVVGLRESKVITINPLPLGANVTGTIGGAVSIDAAGDASKVYVIHANDQITISGLAQPVRNGSLSIIKTSSDTETTDLNGNITRIPAPQQDPACTPKTVTGVTGQVPCDLQIPIVVRVTP